MHRTSERIQGLRLGETCGTGNADHIHSRVAYHNRRGTARGCSGSMVIQLSPSAHRPARKRNPSYRAAKEPIRSGRAEAPTHDAVLAASICSYSSAGSCYYRFGVDAIFFSSRAKRHSFGVRLAPSCCENCANDRVTLLHITDAGKLLLNEEQEDWNGLAGRLSEIYRVREQRTLDLVADDGVPFQTVADALDIVENAPVAAGSQPIGMEMDKLDITVRLVTPNVWNARCREPVATGSNRHASK